jgi:hypothetical protein
MARLSGRAKLGVTIAALATAAVAGYVLTGQTPPAPPAAAPLAAAPVAAPAAAAASIPAVVGAGKHGVTVTKTQLDKPLWKDLTPIQQQALEPLTGEWDKMEGLRKKKWLEVAARYSSMKPEEQQRLHERMREFIKLTPEQRRQVRQTYARTQKLDPGEKSAQWEQYQQLPEEQKQKLAAAANAKKQVANLPSPSQGKVKTVPPIKARVIIPDAGGQSIPATAPATLQAGGATPAPLAPASNVQPVPVTPIPPPAASTPANVK